MWLPPGIRVKPPTRSDSLAAPPSTAGARALGYAPQDDSERYAPKLLAEHGELDPDNPEHTRLGGHFTTRPPMWPH